MYNFVTKRGLCRGDYSKLSWTQVETGSAITWKYPSCVLSGEGSVGEFYSVAVTNNYQQADTGTKMIHLGRNSRSTIVSKGISAGHSQNSYRGLVKVAPKADGCRNYTQCDSLLLSPTCGAHTFPYICLLYTSYEVMDIEDAQSVNDSGCVNKAEFVRVFNIHHLIAYIVSRLHKIYKRMACIAHFTVRSGLTEHSQFLSHLYETIAFGGEEPEFGLGYSQDAFIRIFDY